MSDSDREVTLDLGFHMQVVKKSGKVRGLKRGVREVVKSLRKDVKGIVVFAGGLKSLLTNNPSQCYREKSTHTIE